MRVIEFQKRGLPHAHMLIILQQRHAIRSSQQVDEIVSAEIPPHPDSIHDPDPDVQQQKRDQAQKLRTLVLRNMVHGPCGRDKRNAPCMYNAQGEITEVCHKSFPKQFMKDTKWDEAQSYATYKRRSPEDGGGEAVHNHHAVNNAWIVPYSPYLLLRYNCHINVEICASNKATKNLYKYIHKGGDKASMRLDEEGQPIMRNEVREFQDLKSFGASEATWRIFEFPMSTRYPAIKRLPIHLEKEQPVFFHEDASIVEALERSEITELTAFFKYNSDHPETNMPYIKFPEQFIFDDKMWKIRKRGTNTLGRIYSIHPSKGEVFYLRMLLCDTTLNHSAGKTSFEHLRSVNNVTYGSYKETCRALGMLKDDELWFSVMEDARQQNLPMQMRELFVILMTFSDVNDPKALFEAFWEPMAEDFEYQLRTLQNNDPQLPKWMLLIDIQERLESSGNGKLFQRIGIVTAEMQLAVSNARRQYNLYGECREIREELAYDKEQMAHDLNIALNGEGPQQKGKFTASQQRAFDTIKEAVLGRNNHKQIYIDARGGTGKTFLLNRLLYDIRLLDHDAIAIAVAFTGIAAQLLQGGRTFNSRFKFPLKPDSRATCNISKQSGLSKLIQKAKIIVWDEAPMSHKVLLEGLDRTLQDLMDCKQPFGGKVIVLAGDFRQLPTVIPKASRAQIVAASFKKSYLWQKFKVMRLNENTRIQNNGNDVTLRDFDQWLENLGDGKLQPIEEEDSFITLPEDLCVKIDENQVEQSRNNAIDFTFGDIATQSALPEWMEFVASRAILATTNQCVDEINNVCLDKLPGDEIIIPSADATVNPDDATHYPVEYINS